MKTQIFPKTKILAIGGMVLMAVNAFPQISNNAPAAPALAYGVSDVLKLSQAKVSDDTIIAYIKSSRNSYGLNASQILYLKDQGVSDQVLTAMLNQPRPGATQPVPLPQTPAPVPEMMTAGVPATTAPPVTYVDTTPTTYYVQPDYYPVYSYYYSWPYPVVSLGWGWGGWYHGGHWHWYGGGWHGGVGVRGAGFHGAAISHAGGGFHGGGHR